ncbi:MAG: hypothetical protein KGQ47_13755 [Hyphomicrobiales bacterium]|nr:hypothetical protein [Hyphomicrobiales bacterium]
MQNTALKHFDAPLPETSKKPHFSLYPIRNDSERTHAKAVEISPLLKKEKRCCDNATD